MKSDIIEYNFPQDLKEMTLAEAELLSYSIRDFLISKVSSTGGHLASNLGVVELTIALHKVFDSPKDKIIWDVGHQAYVHKILTGRAKYFDTLRKLDGLSGFPKGKESPHDVYDTGHSSVSISAAYGMAAARDIKGENYDVVAVIGDGSITGGMAYEALNNIGESKSKVIVILNDNGMSISPNIGGISKHLSNIRTSKGYLDVKKFLKNRVVNIPNIGKPLVNSLADFKNDIKYSILDNGGVLLEELGITYFGPVDGHNIKDLVDVLNKAKSLDEPVFIHVITQKGKGYINAEKAPSKFHGIGPFDTTTGVELKKSSGRTFSSLMGECISDKASEDKRIVAITAAMCEATGLYEFSQKYPDRFFDVGIAEEHAVSFAAGLAKGGMKPVVCIYSSFLQRAYDQILEDVCMQQLPVIFAIDRAGCVGADGETHHGMFDISYLSTIPNITILAPKDGNQLKAMFDYALTLNKPVAIRYPRGEAVFDKNIMYTYSKKNHRLKKGSAVDIWACGKMVSCGEKVCDILENHGIKAGLVEVSQIKPLDISPIKECSCNTRLIATIEDNSLSGGFGQQMASKISGLPYNIMNFGWPDEFIPQGTVDELADKYGLTPIKIAERICEYLER
ncbi:MAG: 1-deoxy-D-xylulose-5-phosphate synthase [Anaerovoracaceae bacterium]|nr:1-deoxy-D-xylulose-5-phosphate synthase [Bacillota bacterium]MEE0517366.1 1-deoxy-D-xylulose-5-phosphate synthase [Anaerovoracaceae bacterium]